MKPIWTLVADRSRAIIYSSRSRTKAPTLIEVIEPLEDAATTTRMGSEKRGQSFDSRRRAIPARFAPGEPQAMIFAHKIAQALEASSERFERLVVVAPAPFMAILRASFHGRLKARTVRSVVKEVAAMAEREVAGIVQQLIADELNASAKAHHRGATP